MIQACVAAPAALRQSHPELLRLIEAFIHQQGQTIWAAYLKRYMWGWDLAAQFLPGLRQSVYRMSA